jgi:hypothetical protein
MWALRAILTLVLALAGMDVAAVASTAFAAPQFRLSLPGQWTGIPSADPTLYQYQSANGKENLSVTVLLYAPGTPSLNAQKSLERFLVARRKMEISVAGQANVELGPIKYGAQGTSATASYRGVQQNSARRFLAFAIANKLGIHLFYYEALDATAAEFDARSLTMLGSVQLVE